MPHVDLNYIDKTRDRMLITESDQFRMIDRLSSIDANIDQSDNKSFKARQITFGEDLCGNFESNRIFIQKRNSEADDRQHQPSGKLIEPVKADS